MILNIINIIVAGFIGALAYNHLIVIPNEHNTMHKVDLIRNLLLCVIAIYTIFK